MRAVLLLAPLLALPLPLSQARDYFVDQSIGNDANDGMSLQTPFKTIQRAADVISAGDTCYIRAGVYRETIRLNSTATATSRIRFKAAFDEEVVISGTRAIPRDTWEAVPQTPFYEARVQTPLPPESIQVFLKGKMIHQARTPDPDPDQNVFSPVREGQKRLRFAKFDLPVLLRAPDGHFIRAESGGGMRVLADGTDSDQGTVFALFDINGGSLISGDEVRFMCYDAEHFLTAENGGIPDDIPYNTPSILVANREEASNWQTFTIKRLDGEGQIANGDRVALRSNHDGYVCAEGRGGGQVSANRSAPYQWESFTILFRDSFLRVPAFDHYTDFASSDWWAGAYIWGIFREPGGEAGSEYGLGGWSMSMAKISHSEPGILYLTDSTDNENWGRDFVKGEGFVIGAWTGLSTAGEWSYRNGSLYLIPFGTNDLSSVEIRTRNWVLDITGSNTTFEDIDFFAGNIAIRGDSNHLVGCKILYPSHFVHRPTIGEYEGAEDGTNGIWIRGSGTHIRDCELAYAAGSGAVISGDSTWIDNCLIHDFGYMGTYSSGVEIEGTGDIEHCTIYRGGRDLLHIQRTRGIGIHYNHLHSGGLLADDQGMIYTFGTNLSGPNGESADISHNWFHGYVEGHVVSTGVYLDNGTRNVIVHHNVFWDFSENAAIAVNSPHEGIAIFNNTLIHNLYNNPDNPDGFRHVGDTTYCNCNFDRNRGLPDPLYFESIGECEHKQLAGGTWESTCIHDSAQYWKNRLYLSDNFYTALNDPERGELRNPIVILDPENSWRILNTPDFRPKDGSSLVDTSTGAGLSGGEIAGDGFDIGAYEARGTNWVAGYLGERAEAIDVHFRTDDGHYLTAENGGGYGLNAQATSPSRWETFTLIDLDGGEIESGDRVFLKCWNNRDYVVAEQGGGAIVNANRTAPYSWETFTILKMEDPFHIVPGTVGDGSMVALKTKTKGLFVVAEGGGGGVVNANREHAWDWERLRVTFSRLHSVWLKTTTGHYMVAEGAGGGEVNANRTAAYDWETFNLTAASSEITGLIPRGNLCTLRAWNNNYYIVAAGQDHGDLNATSQSNGSNATFAIAVGRSNRFDGSIHTGDQVILVGKDGRVVRAIGGGGDGADVRGSLVFDALGELRRSEELFTVIY